MKQRTAGRDDSERLRRALSELRQQNEQLRVKRESAEQEIALAAAQSAALEATIAGLRNESLHQRHAILELQAELVTREASESDLAKERDNSVSEGELLRKELAVTSEELGVSDQELVKANAALIERTAELAKVVLQLSETVAQRDALLEEQSLLAREVDHRVKNSLQMVTSLLAMQAAAAHAESEQRALQLAAMRVQAIAHAHGLLYRAGGSDSVSFQDYLAALCRDLKAALAPETGREIDCQAEAIQVPADYALPLALVVNELVTNAFKHAFPGNRKGRVEVSFTRRRDRGWRLRIADDGVGLPGWPWRDGSHGLGIRIVDALVDRLHGRLDVATDHGTRFTLDIEPQ